MTPLSIPVSVWFQTFIQRLQKKSFPEQLIFRLSPQTPPAEERGPTPSPQPIKSHLNPSIQVQPRTNTQTNPRPLAPIQREHLASPPHLLDTFIFGSFLNPPRLPTARLSLQPPSFCSILSFSLQFTQTKSSKWYVPLPIPVSLPCLGHNLPSGSSLTPKATDRHHTHLFQSPFRELPQIPRIFIARLPQKLPLNDSPILTSDPARPKPLNNEPPTRASPAPRRRRWESLWW